MREYVTAEDEVPEVPAQAVTIQVTDEETKEIFRTRATIAAEPDDLTDPAPLTVVRGPHENIHEQLYIEVLDAEMDGREIESDLLRESIQRSRDGSNIVNARSDDLRALLVYLVETGEYTSVSAAVREILLEHLSAEYPDLIEAYADVRADLDREELTTALNGDRR